MIKIVMLTFMIVSLGSLNKSQAGSEGMKDLPLIKAGKIHTVDGSEDFESEKGFGDEEPMVKMMNLMMVEGSGYEGMSMGKAITPKSAPSPSEHWYLRPSLVHPSPNHSRLSSPMAVSRIK